MNRKLGFISTLTSMIMLLFILKPVIAEEPRTIPLPAPHTEGGKALFQALKERSSTREYAPDPVPLPVLSNLLWAAFGISRPDSGKRTAPSAHNWQEIDVYVAMKDGLYRYDAQAHRLTAILDQDIRAKTGVQPFVAEAPVNLIFVADLSRMGNASAEEKAFYAAVDTGFISQNVYLCCASEGLATVVRRWMDRPELAKAMNLRPDQEIILSQTVGYPRK